MTIAVDIGRKATKTNKTNKHTGPESHELTQIGKYLDSWLNRTQFVKVLTDSHSPQRVLAIRRSIGNSAQKF